MRDKYYSYFQWLFKVNVKSFGTLLDVIHKDPDFLRNNRNYDDLRDYFETIQSSQEILDSFEESWDDYAEYVDEEEMKNDEKPNSEVGVKNTY